MRVSPLRELGQRLAQEQDQLLAQRAGELAGIREHLQQVGAPRASRRRWFVALALPLASAAALLLWSRPEAAELECWVDSRRLEEPVGTYLTSESRPLSLGFSDGTTTRLAPATRARIAALDARGAHLVLESGRARFEVKPNSDARWRVSTGPFLVEVTGTKFDVAWHPEQDSFELHLEQGQVQLSGCMFGEEGKVVMPGETVRASCRRRTSELLGEGGSADAALAPEEPSTPEPSPKATRSAASAGSTWRELAGKGRYDEALDAIGPNFALECSRVSARELMLLGDAARFAGRPQQSEQAYLSLRRRFAGSELAGLAAFALARLAFDQRSDHAAAIRWLHTYLREQPGGKFAREAEGRLIEALHRSGDQSTARRQARRYLQHHPNGPHARLARDLLARAP